MNLKVKNNSKSYRIFAVAFSLLKMYQIDKKNIELYNKNKVPKLRSGHMKTECVRYLERLSELYPTIDKASTEIINLQSILNLPKGTEHFLSDIHGEYESFSHVLRNGSGAVRKKIYDVLGHTLGTNYKIDLASLIYYTKEKID